MAAHIKSGAAVLSCRRTFHDLEGADLNIREPDEDQRLHVDTSCLLLFRPAFSTLRAWFMPAALGPICDRIFIAKILNDKFKVVSINNRSVAFRTQYKFHYELAGVPVPKGAKSADEFQPGFAYIADPANAKALVAALGFLPIATERPVPAGGNIPPAAQPRPQAG